MPQVHLLVLFALLLLYKLLFPVLALLHPLHEVALELVAWSGRLFAGGDAGQCRLQFHRQLVIAGQLSHLTLQVVLALVGDTSLVTRLRGQCRWNHHVFNLVFSGWLNFWLCWRLLSPLFSFFLFMG